MRRIPWLCVALAAGGCVGVEGAPPQRPIYPDKGRTAIDAPPPGILHLTFDDGPSGDYTRDIVDTLVRHHAPATFFQIGLNIPGNRGLLDALRDRGFQIANHSYYHDLQPSLSEELFKAETRAVKANISDRDQGRLYYRFPYGAAGDDQLRWLEQELDFDGKRYRAVGWNVDSHDWEFGSHYPDVEFSATVGDIAPDCGGVPNPFDHDMVGWVQFEARKVGGGVVLFHDVLRITHDRLDEILTGFETPAAYWQSLDAGRRQSYQAFYQCENVNPDLAFRYAALHEGPWPSLVE